MTKEDKELLLKDLCARLPYGVKCRFETTVDTYKTKEFSREGNNGLFVDFDEIWCYWLNEGFVIPYLRPMSSMTEEERDEYTDIKKGECNGCVLTGKGDPDTEFLLVDWLNAHHFDYRGLISMGLALEAPEDMYSTNTKGIDIKTL